MNKDDILQSLDHHNNSEIDVLYVWLDHEIAFLEECLKNVLIENDPRATYLHAYKIVKDNINAIMAVKNEK